MATWKELGEVPDSDDESDFDTQESQHQQQLPHKPVEAHDGQSAARAAEEDGNHDVWDLPTSPQSSQRRDALDLSSDAPMHALPPVDASSPLSSPPQSQEAESHYVYGARETSRDAPGDANHREESHEELAPTFEDLAQELEADLELQAIQYGRALRPRKPIQEHPYLLENAHYASMFKSHGMRPVRMTVEERARQSQQEDSQEKDWEDDTQSTWAGIVQEESQGTQSNTALDPFGDIDELAPSPSRPSRSLEQAVPDVLDDLFGSSQEELPSLEDVFNKHPKVPSMRVTKRKLSPMTSAKRKAPRVQQTVRLGHAATPNAADADVFNIPPSPPQTSPALLATTPYAALRRTGTISTITPKPSSTNVSAAPSPMPDSGTERVVDLTVDGQSESGNDSEHETDVVERARRRIRGVLPASWLRLDQQIAQEKSSGRHIRRGDERSPEREQRKGVAQRRQASPKSTHATTFFFDDSDNEESVPPTGADLQTPVDAFFSIFDEDAGSVVEEDHIDAMLPTKKRRRPSFDLEKASSKRRKARQSIFKGQPGQIKRQQRITGLLGSTPNSSSGQQSSHRSSGKSRTYSKARPAPARPPTPPRLSVVDVIEADAPPFMRIAARTARRRENKGRTSPGSKRINLGNRKDNIDALSVLQNWKAGKIRPRASADGPPKPRQTTLPKPLHEISNNTTQKIMTEKRVPHLLSRGPSVVPRLLQPRKVVKQSSLDHHFVSSDAPSDAEGIPPSLSTEHLGQPHAKRSEPRRVQSYATSLRPAQLETTGTDRVDRVEFSIRKKALDAMYRKSRRSLTDPLHIRLDQVISGSPSISHESSSEKEPQLPQIRAKERRRLVRKSLKPKQVDIDAPHYTHANDPLPQEPPQPAQTPLEFFKPPEKNSDDKLAGLGAYGTHYTQHFEIFPLDQGVFFHESTLIGSGRLAKLFESNFANGLRHSRGRCSIALDQQLLHWGPWDAQTSSEFGILTDHVIDRVSQESSSLNSSQPSLVSIADFLIKYTQDHMSFPDADSERSFIDKTLESLPSFTDRLTSLPGSSTSSSRVIIELLSRTLILTAQIWRTSQMSDMVSESFRLEDVLKKVAGQLASKLLAAGLKDVKILYDDLQQASFRDRGIRGDQFCVVGWVVLMRILEEAKIPRARFWDIVFAELVPVSLGTTTDAQVLEDLWDTMFSLLPLGEFDNTGVVIAGLRDTIPLEGWALPQKLIGRVFELYKANSRQSPSFNDYCRGMVSRCYYLVEQWGWRKCNAIVGTIFDFFASQNLSHLRNEEVRKSPQFLEDLASRPSLALLPEDRCFHIFLKLLALAIKRLRQFNLAKDVRNLVFRVVPNHDRQYSKEQDVHETDLAALRNHHDLLCTLFWSAPPESRPSVQTIERLVNPASSHKEACLINLRAWNQLAKFVVASCEDQTVYRTFVEWQNNVFKQVLEQYLSVESDVQQQFLLMSKETLSGISSDLRDKVVKQNKQASMDILHFSMKASLDVLQQASSLSAASAVVNTYQLTETFNQFTYSQDFDWSVLRVALDILAQYLARIESFLDQQLVESQIEEAWQGEDAILNLDRNVSTSFFSMARNILKTTPKVVAPMSDRELCLGTTVLVAARMAARFIGTATTRLSAYFSKGKFCVFEGLPYTLTIPATKFLPLFMSTLIEKGVADFSDLGLTTVDLLLSSITHPAESFGYENRLATTLKRAGLTYLANAVVETGNTPDYNSNRDLFAHIITAMRKANRVAPPSERKRLESQHAKALGSTMNQIKRDLKSLVCDSAEHVNYIQFVRSIISLIKSHDICPVDNFFLQISREYAPPAEDPGLQTATILSYGFKLEEAVAGTYWSLFYLLLNNFKVALTNGTLTSETSILTQTMDNSHILSFVIGTLLPAMIKAAVPSPGTEQSRKYGFSLDAWILLDPYVTAVEQSFTDSAVPEELGQACMNSVLTFTRTAYITVQHVNQMSLDDFRPEVLYILTRIARLINVLGPSAAAYMYMQPASPTAESFAQLINLYTEFTRPAGQYLSSYSDSVEEGPSPPPINLVRLFTGVKRDVIGGSSSENSQSEAFALEIAKDIKNNWVVGNGVITVRAPGKPREKGVGGTQSANGTKVPDWSIKSLIGGLRVEIEKWNAVHDVRRGAERSKRSVLEFNEEFWF